MQNTKDTFYELLRARLVALNPERTIVVRGLTRPGVLVDDNELPALTGHTPALADCFHLHWTDVATDPAAALTTVTQVCEISYETAGTASNGGMDRGRLLSAMDAELCAAINQLPRNVPKQSFTALAHSGTSVTETTRIWWSKLVPGKTEHSAARITRKATVTVMSAEKAGQP